MTKNQIERIGTKGWLGSIIEKHYPVELMRLGKYHGEPVPELRKNDPEMTKAMFDLMDKEL